MRLYLEGIQYYHGLLKDNQTTRITAFALSLIVLVKETVRQLGRAMMHLASLNPARFKTALRDLMGGLIQGIALPCLGICATFSPEEAAKWTQALIDDLDMPRFGLSAWIPQVSPASDIFARTLGGLLALPIVTTSLFSDVLIRSLTGEEQPLNQLLGELGEACLHTLSLGMYAACREGENDLFNVYHIYFPEPRYD